MIQKKISLICKLLIIGAIIFPGLLITGNIQAQSMDWDICNMENSTFKSGEILVYKVYYNLGPIWLPAGEVNFSIKEDDQYYYINVVGRSYKNYRKIYYVHDRYKSKIRKHDLLPEEFVRDVIEGSFQRYDSILFNQQEKSLTSYWGKTKDHTSPFSFQLEECMHDMLSILYYVRNINFNDFTAGDKIPVHLFLDKKGYNLSVEYEGIRTKKKVKHLLPFSSFKIKTDLVKGHVFKDGSKMDIWISIDDNQIPLLIESPLIIGSVKVILKSYSGLKYPFEAYTSYK